LRANPGTFQNGRGETVKDEEEKERERERERERKRERERERERELELFSSMNESVLTSGTRMDGEERKERTRRRREEPLMPFLFSDIPRLSFLFPPFNIQ